MTKRLTGKELARKRVTVTMSPDLYALFHRFAEEKGWSDDRAGARLIWACFQGSVYSLIPDVKMKPGKFSKGA